jgi:hypothetical protein
MRRNYAKRRIVIPQRLVNALSELGESIVTEVSEEEGGKCLPASCNCASAVDRTIVAKQAGN